MKLLVLLIMMVGIIGFVSAITPGESPYGLLDKSVNYNVTSSGDNSSWNQTLAGTLYAPIGSGSDNSSWNETYAWTIFVPYEGAIQEVNLGANDLRTYASVHGAGVNVSSPGPIILMEDSGGVEDSWYIELLESNLTFYKSKEGLTGRVRFDDIGNIWGYENITADYFLGDGSQLTGISGGNTSWNQTMANNLYESEITTQGCGGTAKFRAFDTSNQLFTCAADESFNTTYASFATNVSLNYTKIVFDAYNSTWDDSGDGTDNASWNELRANTLYAPISITPDNESWNQTLADTLYEPIRDNGSTVMKFEGSKFMIKLT